MHIFYWKKVKMDQRIEIGVPVSLEVKMEPFAFLVLGVTQDGKGHIPKSGVRPQCRVGEEAQENQLGIVCG